MTPGDDIVRQLRASNEALRRDLAARAEVEAVLRASESQWRALIESMPQIVWITRPDGWHVHFNQQWMEFTGLTLEQSLGHGWNPPFHPEDRARAAARWEEATRTGEPYEIEYRLRRVDGTYRWMLGRAMPLRDATGAIVRWFGTCTDIEELKQAQARADKQARLLDQTQDAVQVHDLEHRVVYWNKGAERIHGWTAAEAVGRLLDELICPDPSQADAALAVLLDRGEWTGELRYVDKDGGEVLMEGRWSLLRSDDGTPEAVLAVNTDVTERAMAAAREAELSATEARRAHQSDKLRAVGELTGGVAHDFNNLLLGVSASVELAQQRLDAGEDVGDALNHVRGLVERGSSLVSDLLAFARRDEGNPGPTSLGSIVASLRPMVERLISSDIDVHVAVPEDLPSVPVAHGQLERVLMNLILNAMDAMPQGGTMTIEAQAVAPGSRDDGGWVQLTLTDTGVGMSADVIERAFEPFFTTKPVGSGSGLGLAGVHGIVHAAGGLVILDSEPGEGTTVTVLLPASDAVTTTDEPVRPVPPSPAVATHAVRATRLLLVEDQETLRVALASALEREGYRVVAVADGGEALRTVETAEEPFDLVITDVVMPVLSGPELVMRLRQERPDLPALLISGYAADHLEEVRRLDPALTRFTAKPFRLEELRTGIGELLMPLS